MGKIKYNIFVTVEAAIQKNEDDETEHWEELESYSMVSEVKKEDIIEWFERNLPNEGPCIEFFEEYEKEMETKWAEEDLDDE